MSKVLIKNSTLTNIAEAIREHGQGNTSLMKPSEMPEYIANIDTEKVTIDGVKVNEKLDLSIPEVQNDLIIMLDKNPLCQSSYTIHSILPNGNIIATYYSYGDKMLVYDSEKESVIVEDINIEDLTIITSDNEIYAQSPQYQHLYSPWFILYKLNFETKKFEVCKALTDNNPGKYIISKPIIFNNKFIFIKENNVTTTVDYNIKFTVGVIEIDNNTSSQPVYFDVMQPYDSNLTDRSYSFKKFFVLDKHLYYYLTSPTRSGATAIAEQYFGRFNEQITAKDTEIIVNNPITYMSNIYVFDNQIMGYKASGYIGRNFILYRLVNNQWETVLDTFFLNNNYTYQVNNTNGQPLYFYTYTGCYGSEYDDGPMGYPEKDNYLNQDVLNMYLYTLNYNTNSFDEIVFNYMPWYYNTSNTDHYVSVEPYMIKYLNNNTILIKCKFHSKYYNNSGPYYKIIKSLDNSPVFYLKNN